MATGTDIAKAGWLQRESSVLKRWKRNWVVLDRQGDLRYFDTPDRHTAEERIVVRAQVSCISTGFDCGSTSPPEKGSKSCLFILHMTNGEKLVLCGETPDDMKAWQIALEEARTLQYPNSNNGMATQTMTVVQPMSSTYFGGPSYYSGYPGRVISSPGVTVLPQTTVIAGNGGYGAYGGNTLVTNPGQQVVYMNSSPYYSRRGLWGPYLW